MQRRTLLARELEPEEIGARVVADGIEHPLALDDEREIEVGDDEPLTFRQRRSQERALG